ncbi:MAG TPA: DUF2934 domain-containing protein [Casimicrobiaceae bacterium]|nr:DUF2934 domain-containing protein [Casimicrobiaceae bacterium]
MAGKMVTGHRHTAHARPKHPHVVATLMAEGAESEVAAPAIESEVRYRMISEAAYHRYLDRGCEDGFDVDDWLAAEAEVERQLSHA